MEDVIFFIVFFAVLLIGIVLFYNLSNKYREAHPKQCSFCNGMFPAPLKLLDGYICGECMRISYEGKEIDLKEFIVNSKKKITVDSLKQFESILFDRGNENFQATRISPSGVVVVDDNLGMLKINKIYSDRISPLPYAHRLSDIESFKLVIEKDIAPGSDATSYVSGGHIVVKLKELFDETYIWVPVDQKMFGMKGYIKKVYEDELMFLENVTGKKRG